MGDHNVVALKHDETQDRVEVLSPYLADQFGNYYLLRPVFHIDQCRDCGRLTLFVLDGWSRTAELAEYKALDHSHVCHVPAGIGLRRAAADALVASPAAAVLSRRTA